MQTLQEVTEIVDRLEPSGQLQLFEHLVNRLK